jgi:formylglycine-generating enzyme required for sulfatase activity
MLSIAISLFPLVSVAQTPNSFVEKLTKHLVEFKMIKIPDGEIKSGDKTLKIQNIYFSETEIPFEVFDIFALQLDRSVEDQTAGANKDQAGKAARPSRPYAAIFINFGNRGYPAICASAHSTTLFCEWLSQQTGKKYRMPTAAEWEYAARAGSDLPPNVEKVAWCFENAEDTTHPIGQKPANNWGLKDMLGNAAEWTRNAEGKFGIMGGSWQTLAKDFSFSAFSADNPMWNDADPQVPKSRWWLANGQHVGIRLVCESK